MRTIYIADDETEFKTEEECRRYEEQQLNLPRSILNIIVGFDADGIIKNDIKQSPTESLEALYNDSQNIIVFNDLTKEQIDYLDNQLGASNFPHEKGTYRWSDYEWISLEDDLKTLHENWKNVPSYIGHITEAMQSWIDEDNQ